MRLALTRATRQDLLELMNTTSNQEFRNKYTELYIQSCKMTLKKAMAATTA